MVPTFPLQRNIAVPAAETIARFPGMPGLASDLTKRFVLPAASATRVDRPLVYTSVSETVPALGRMAWLA